MSDPLPPYEGDQPFVFISYSHADNATVLNEIAWLQSQGIRIWYDVGISTGSRWSDDLAKHILNADSLVFFATPNSVESENCLDEINYALDNSKKVVVVHLAQTELPPGAALRLSHRQAIYRHELDEAAYRQRLLAAIDSGSSSPAVEEPVARQQRKVNFALAGVVALILAFVGGLYFFSGLTSEEAVEEVTTAEPQDSPQPAVDATSIAVLPFENLSPNPDDAYFAAGIHDEVLTQLAQIPELSVIARSSVLQYAANPKPATQVAKELGVGTVIEGTVRYAGDRVRISAQLINGSTGAQLWSNVFEQQLVDVFEIQQAIGQQVAEALKLEFTLVDRPTVATPPTADTIAYSHYLRALALWGNFQNIRQANAALDAAIARDPEFADAWAFKAMISNFEGGFPQFQADPADFTPELSAAALMEAVKASQRALELDSQQAYPHMVLGVDRLLAHADFEGSEYHLDEALRLRPQDYFILSSIASFRIRSGRIEEGLDLFRRSVEINPADGAAMWWYSIHLDNLEMFDEAIERAEHAVAMLPAETAFGHANLAIIAARAGRTDLAREAIENALARTPNFLEMADIAMAEAFLGNESQAKKMVAELRQEFGHIRIPSFHLKLISAAGEYDQALDLFESALENPAMRNAVLVNLYQDIAVRENAMYRHLPRYRALVARARSELNGPR